MGWSREFPNAHSGSSPEGLRDRSDYEGPVATGLICQAIRDPSAATDPLITAAAQAQKDLHELHRKAVWEHGLEFDFVRKEWAAILDPVNKW